jgi:hypothetical protein
LLVEACVISEDVEENAGNGEVEEKEDVAIYKSTS